MARRAALLALALAAPPAARAHGAVELEIERSAGGVAVRAHHHQGRPLAGASYVVLAPGAPGGRVHDEGRTDRHGWLAFVPDAPGRWTVRVVDGGGHGRVQEIDVPPEAIRGAPAAPAVAPAAAPQAAPPDAPPTSPPISPLRADEARERAGALYRVVGGLAVIFLVFFALFAVALRRRGPGR